MCDNNDKPRPEFSPWKPLLLRDLSPTMLEIKNASAPHLKMRISPALLLKLSTQTNAE